MYNDKLVYKIVIWVVFGIGLLKEKETLTSYWILEYIKHVSMFIINHGESDVLWQISI